MQIIFFDVVIGINRTVRAHRALPARPPTWKLRNEKQMKKKKRKNETMQSLYNNANKRNDRAFFLFCPCVQTEEEEDLHMEGSYGQSEGGAERGGRMRERELLVFSCSSFSHRPPFLFPLLA